MQLIISPNKEPFTSISTENNTVADNDFNNNINNNNTVKEGGSYLNSWFKRSCSCAEGFENAYSNSNTVFDFYKYTKLSKNKNYQLNGFNDLQNIVVHTKTQMKMYYYNFQYKLKEYIDITDKIIFEPGKGVTICFWLKIHNLYYNSDSMTILALNLGDETYIKIVVNSAGLHLILNAERGSYYIQSIRDIAINNNTWNHIVWTMSAESSKDWNVYFNGVHHKTIKNQNYPVTKQATEYIQLIGTDTSYTEYFDGDLGDLRISNNVLDGDQIQYIYNNPATATNNSSNNSFFQISNNNNLAKTYNKYKSKTWWGSGFVIEENKVENSQQCEDMCNRHAHCSGATYNPDKKHCWVVKGDGKLTSGLNTDYAFIPSSSSIITTETPVNI